MSGIKDKEAIANNFVRPLEKAQLKATSNRKNPSSLMFIREDGKIGFPTSNSIRFSNGDIISGTILQEEETYFMIRVEKVLESKK
jgi:hypothetical protein